MAELDLMRLLGGKPHAGALACFAVAWLQVACSSGTGTEQAAGSGGSRAGAGSSTSSSGVSASSSGSSSSGPVCPVGTAETSVLAPGPAGFTTSMPSRFTVATDGASVFWADSVATPSAIRRCATSGCNGAPATVVSGAVSALAAGPGTLYYALGAALFACESDACSSPVTVTTNLYDGLVTADASGVYWFDATDNLYLKGAAPGGASVRSSLATGFWATAIASAGPLVGFVQNGDVGVLDTSASFLRVMSACTGTWGSGPDCEPMTNGPVAVNTKDVYWAAGTEIAQCAVTGCGATPSSFHSGAGVVNQVATDELRVYWTEFDGGCTSVLACPVPGPCAGAPAVLFSAPTASAAAPVSNLAVDANGVYWMRGDGAIVKAPAVAPYPDGHACSATADCASGFCVDGLCCDEACDEACHACSAAQTGSGVDGTCGDALSGTNPGGLCATMLPSTCGTTGTCDGKGSCATYAAGTDCGPVPCADGVPTHAAACDANGSCAGVPTTSCAPFACAGTSCKTSCATSADCFDVPCDTCPGIAFCLAPLAPLASLAAGVCKAVAPSCSAGAPTTCGGPAGTVTTTSGASSLAFDGASMWLIGLSENFLEKVSPSGATLATFPVQVPLALAFDGTSMWVTNGLSPDSVHNEVAVLSLAGTQLGSYLVGAGPSGIAFDGTNMWVANQYDGTVTELDPSGVTVATIAVGQAPRAVAFDGTNVWVLNTGDSTVTKLAPSGVALGTFPVATQPSELAFDGASMWVSSSQTGTVSKLSLTGALLGTFTIPACTKPSALAFDGLHLWVTCAGQQVAQLDLSGDVLGSFLNMSPASPGYAMAFDGAHLWVSSGSATITEL